MDKQKTEEFFNETYSGLTLYFRDVNLSETLIGKYKPFQILMEKAFTDLTYKGGGLAQNLRYAVASASAKDLGMFNPEMAQYGFMVLKAPAYFKVLDVYQVGNKTQILLLHFPEYGLDIVQNAKTNIDDQIIEKARKSFDDKLNQPPLPELQEKIWMERTAFPIGMSDSGEWFYNNPASGTAQKEGTPENTPKPKGFWKRLFG